MKSVFFVLIASSFFSCGTTTDVPISNNTSLPDSRILGYWRIDDKMANNLGLEVKTNDRGQVIYNLYDYDSDTDKTRTDHSGLVQFYSTTYNQTTYNFLTAQIGNEYVIHRYTVRQNNLIEMKSPSIERFKKTIEKKNNPYGGLAKFTTIANFQQFIKSHISDPSFYSESNNLRRVNSMAELVSAMSGKAIAYSTTTASSSGKTNTTPSSPALSATNSSNQGISSSTHTSLFERLIKNNPYTGSFGPSLKSVNPGSISDVVVHDKDRYGRPTKIHGYLEIMNGFGKIQRIGMGVLLQEDVPFALVFDDLPNDYISPNAKMKYDNEEDRLSELDKYLPLQRKHYYDKVMAKYANKYPRGYVGAEYLKYESRNITWRQRGTKQEVVDGPNMKEILVEKDVYRDVESTVKNLYNTTNHNIYVPAIGRIVSNLNVQEFKDYTQAVSPNAGLNTNFDRTMDVETGDNYWKSHKSGIYIFGVIPRK